MLRDKLISLSFGFLLVGGFAAGATLLVPDQYKSIQGALDAAQSGDTVLVKPGVYVENINFKGKAVYLKSQSGPEETVIDGSGASEEDPFGCVVAFVSGEGPDSVIEGFTIRGGIGWFNPVGKSRYGGGIAIRNSSPKVLNCIITENSAVGGGGIFICGQSASQAGCEIRNCTVTGNTAYADGGGILCILADSARIVNNKISGNKCQWYGGGISSISGALIAGNVICDNTAKYKGAGICALMWPGRYQEQIINNTICFNHAGEQGGGIYGGKNLRGVMAVVNNIIYKNTAGSGGDNVTCSPSIMFNNLISDGLNEGVNGNIGGDPLFVDPENGDFRLKPDSPCIDAGREVSIQVTKDLLGVPRVIDGDRDGIPQIDIGALEYLPLEKKEFIRGDINDDGKVDMTDCVAFLGVIFEGGELACEDAADSNDDGRLDLADFFYSLEVLVGESASGNLACEPDKTYDKLGCNSYSNCP